jgi:hypothetical protein
VGFVNAPIPLDFPSGALYFQILMTAPVGQIGAVTNIGVTAFINP